jgi:uncharacterized protein
MKAAVCLALFGLQCACSKTIPEPSAQAPGRGLSEAPVVVSVAPPMVSAPQVQVEPAPAPTDRPNPCPVDPEPTAFHPTTQYLQFEKGPNVSIEFVYKPEDTSHGLMYRPVMFQNAGMLFKMKNEVHTFWMHNTCISLDMLFLDEKGVVLGLLENVPPMNDAIRTINEPSVYVLEMNAGYSRQNQIKKGSKLLINPTIRMQMIP